jgi:hypothetical protein
MIKIKRNYLYYGMICLIIPGVLYNIYILYSHNEKYLSNSKYADIIKNIDMIEKSYVGMRTDSLFENINDGIIWVRTVIECNACVESQEIILEKLKGDRKIQLYLYFNGFDERSSRIIALNYGYESNLLKPIKNFDSYFHNAPLLLYIQKKQIVLCNLGYKEMQDRTVAFYETIKRFIANNNK